MNWVWLAQPSLGRLIASRHRANDRPVTGACAFRLSVPSNFGLDTSCRSASTFHLAKPMDGGRTFVATSSGYRPIVVFAERIDPPHGCTVAFLRIMFRCSSLGRSLACHCEKSIECQLMLGRENTEYTGGPNCRAELYLHVWDVTCIVHVPLWASLTCKRLQPVQTLAYHWFVTYVDRTQTNWTPKINYLFAETRCTVIVWDRTWQILRLAAYWPWISFGDAKSKNGTVLEDGRLEAGLTDGAVHCIAYRMLVLSHPSLAILTSCRPFSTSELKLVPIHWPLEV